MGGSRPLWKGWERLLSAWTRNDGKSKEAWAPGVDLKEAVLRGFYCELVIMAANLNIFI